MSDDRKMLLESELIQMRKMGALSESEVAYHVGDLLVAEDVVSGTKRIVESSTPVSTKRILKG